MLIAILAPIVYFAWRAGQPMERREFNGLSHYQFMLWKRTIYAQDAQHYDHVYLNHRPVDGECYDADMTIVPAWQLSPRVDEIASLTMKDVTPAEDTVPGFRPCRDDLHG